MAVEIKEILEEQRLEYQRYLGVLKEDFDKKVDLVLEGFSGQQDRIERIEETLASVAERLSGQQDRIERIEENLIKIEEKIITIEENQLGIQTAIASLTEVVARNTQDVTLLKSKT